MTPGEEVTPGREEVTPGGEEVTPGKKILGKSTKRKSQSHPTQDARKMRCWLWNVSEGLIPQQCKNNCFYPT